MSQEGSNKIHSVKSEHTRLRSKKSDVFWVVISFLALGLVGYGAYGIYDWWQTTKRATIAPPARVEAGRPSEAPLPVIENPPFKYTTDEPKIISIPSIGVNSYIQEVGVDKDNAVGVPSNINLAGWFTGSVIPGKKGLSIVDGHVSGRYKDAIFKNLAKLKPNAKVEIIYGNNSKKTFLVKTINSYSVEKSALPLFEQNPNIESQLNLITCSGIFNKQDQTFDQRTIVVTKLE